MSLNDDKTRHAQGTYRVLIPHWEFAQDGKVFGVVIAGDREAARERAARRLFGTPTARDVQRVTVRYLCNK